MLLGHKWLPITLPKTPWTVKTNLLIKANFKKLGNSVVSSSFSS